MQKKAPITRGAFRKKGTPQDGIMVGDEDCEGDFLEEDCEQEIAGKKSPSKRGPTETPSGRRPSKRGAAKTEGIADPRASTRRDALKVAPFCVKQRVNGGWANLLPGNKGSGKTGGPKKKAKGSSSGSSSSSSSSKLQAQTSSSSKSTSANDEKFPPFHVFDLGAEASAYSLALTFVGRLRFSG